MTSLSRRHRPHPARQRKPATGTHLCVCVCAASGVDRAPLVVPHAAMLPHTRALVAASTFAFVTGKTVAGIYDHLGQRRLKIDAQVKGDQLQGADGDRGIRFGGALPELYDAGDEAYISIEIDGMSATGFDRGSSHAYTARVEDECVQLYDHGAKSWFTYDVQDPNAARNYHRTRASRS